MSTWTPSTRRSISATIRGCAGDRSRSAAAGRARSSRPRATRRAPRASARPCRWHERAASAPSSSWSRRASKPIAPRVDGSEPFFAAGRAALARRGLSRRHRAPARPDAGGRGGPPPRARDPGRHRLDRLGRRLVQRAPGRARLQPRRAGRAHARPPGARESLPGRPAGRGDPRHRARERHTLASARDRHRCRPPSARDPAELVAGFGRIGLLWWNLAHGRDHRPVEPDRPRRRRSPSLAGSCTPPPRPRDRSTSWASPWPCRPGQRIRAGCRSSSSSPTFRVQG